MCKGIYKVHEKGRGWFFQLAWGCTSSPAVEKAFLHTATSNFEAMEYWFSGQNSFCCRADEAGENHPGCRQPNCLPNKHSSAVRQSTHHNPILVLGLNNGAVLISWIVPKHSSGVQNELAGFTQLETSWTFTSLVISGFSSGFWTMWLKEALVPQMFVYRTSKAMELICSCNTPHLLVISVCSSPRKLLRHRSV